MIIEDIESQDLDAGVKNYNILKKGIAVFPETLKEVEKLQNLKKLLIKLTQ